MNIDNNNKKVRFLGKMKGDFIWVYHVIFVNMDVNMIM